MIYMITILKNMHLRKDSRMMMRVLSKVQKWTMNSKNCLILMICVESKTLQCDKHIVCHAGMKWTSCLFHYYKLKSSLACI